MSRVASYESGRPAWVDLATGEVEATIAFYGELFGWTFESPVNTDNPYLLALLDRDPVAGVSITPAGVRSATEWTPYFSVADANEVAVHIATAGGLMSMRPISVGTDEGCWGKMAVVADPVGATFGLWQAGNYPGSRRTNEPGATCWFELVSVDAPRVRRFYNSIFGWKLEQIGDHAGFDYTTALLGSRPVAGIMAAPTGSSEVTPMWLVYFAVADVDAAAALVRRLGGQVLSDPHDSPCGRFCVVQDSQGAVFSAIQLPQEPR
jgi:uncharacterized protein